MIILASNSPRRKELLTRENIEFIIETSNNKEIFDKDMTLEDALLNVALQKASPIYEKHQDEIVIGADTIVVINQEILGKPKNHDDAVRMLQLLSGKTHEVMTGVVILNKTNPIKFVEKTQVTFKELTIDEIEYYITHENVYDKAGSYAIQDGAKAFVTKVLGDYDNIIGLPVTKVVKYLKELTK